MEPFFPADVAISRQALMDELASIRGTTLAALFDEAGVCRSVQRSHAICAFGSYRVLSDVSSSAPGRSALVLDVDGRSVFVRRLFDGGFAVVATGAAADPYLTEVLLVEAASGYALRAATQEFSTAPRAPSVTIPPPAGQSPSELPPIEASLVLKRGTLNSLYRDFQTDFEPIGPDPEREDDGNATIAC